MKDVTVLVDPLNITKFSVIWEDGIRFNERIKNFNCKFIPPKMYGDWDLISKDIKLHSQFKGYEEFKQGKREFYKPNCSWSTLYNSIKDKGYIFKGEPVKIAIGRNGDLLLVDGLHRVIIARDLNIKEIPVKIVYIHSDYNFGKLNYIKDKHIPEFFFNLISEKWSDEKDPYQKYGWVTSRINDIQEHLEIFKGSKVLDIGCNAFMTVWAVKEYAESLIGIEQGEAWYNQALVTRECLKERWGKEKVRLYNQTLKDYVNNNSDKDFNAFFGFCIMYWLSEEDLKILKERILPKCKRVLVSSRTSLNNAYNNSYEFYKQENLIRFFNNEGYTTRSFVKNGMVYLIGSKV